MEGFLAEYTQANEYGHGIGIGFSVSNKKMRSNEEEEIKPNFFIC